VTRRSLASFLATVLVLGVKRIERSSNIDKCDNNGDELELVEFVDAMVFL
jgi:hypothetical protein